MSAPRPGRRRASAPWIAAVLSLPLATALLAQEPAAVAGVVVDSEREDPIPGVEIRIVGSDLMTVTADDGSFLLTGIPRGTQRVVLRHVAYGEHAQALVMEERGTRQYLIRMSRQAIELSPLVVEVPAEAERERLASGNSIDLIERPVIELFDRQGGNLINVLGREVPGIRINAPCVEFRMQANSRGIGPLDLDPLPEWRDENWRLNTTCRWPAIYMDGMRVSMTLDEISLDQLESVEVLSPSEASVRYGSEGAHGVILLETRTGFAPEAGPERVKVTGFQWQDSQPYRWPKVLGVSLASSSVLAAVTFGTFLDCSRQDTGFGTETGGTCNGAFATVGGLVSGTIGGVLTVWAGKSSLTQGRTFPVMLAGTASTTASYLLMVHAENSGSEGNRTVGLVLATAGTALLSTFADRIFRVIR